MPRKTKKKKIIADYRKRISHIESKPVQVEAVADELPRKTVPAKKKPEVKRVVQLVDNERLNKQKALIIRDLRKTVILSTLAIGGLIVISLVPIN